MLWFWCTTAVLKFGMFTVSVFTHSLFKWMKRFESSVLNHFAKCGTLGYKQGYNSS